MITWRKSSFSTSHSRGRGASTNNGQPWPGRPEGEMHWWDLV